MLKYESVYSSSETYSYDVFLSFRGEDTRKTFTDHLYKALQDEGLNTFRDDEEIERGESIKAELENGIKQSKSWIIVFSNNYAYSSWCLDELVMILECRNKSKRLLLPVFYDVDPSDIRKQSGCISEAFSKHEEIFKREVDEIKRKVLMDKIKRWRTALTQVANLGGMPLQNSTNGYESKFILKIVNVIKDKVACNHLTITPHLVGIDASVNAINLWLRDGSTNVEVFALYGIGGVGKTTIAKYVYNMNLQTFEGGSFLESIREYSERSDGLVCLQRQLLLDIYKGKTPTINNLNDGILKIQRALRHRKLLIVLDDVDRAEQLEAIFGAREWFYEGSKIIVTTRYVHLLKAHEQYCMNYEVEHLNFNDSLELFSWHAFRDCSPPECYIEDSERIIKQCQGLPLGLEVLGASLYGKKVDVWRSAIDKLEIIPHCEIQKILRISYESLQDDHDRDLFVEIACFFNGETKSSVVGILDKCNYYTIIGIENLIDRCLLKIDGDERLRMHNLIQRMGREIIRLESPRDPGKRSRVWYYKDSLQILKDETGTGAIEGLALDMNPTNAYQTGLRTEAFSMMHKLRLLKLNNTRLSGSYMDFPKRLIWLCWQGYHLRSLPNDFPLSSLVAIDLQSSKLHELVRGNMLLGSLKFLNLSHCHCIVKIPKFAQLPALEQLILEDCISLVEIDESIQMAEGLVLLNLKDCVFLKKLPKNLVMLKLLETLIISGCSNLSMLPAEMRTMESLKVLHADGLDFGNTSYTTDQENKSWLDFVTGLVLKPRIGPHLSLTSLPCKNVTSLSLANCNLHDNSFPKDFCVAPSLEYLNLSNNPIRFLPDCFNCLKRIKTFVLMDCNWLQALEDLPGIKEIQVLNCPLLTKITFKRGPVWKEITHPYKCEKLIEMESMFKVVPIETIDPELIYNCGIDDMESKKRIQIRLYNTYTRTETRCPIQGIYDEECFSSNFGRRFFSIFYPGSSFPIWFTSQHNVTSISFKVASHSKLTYLNTCVVYNSVPDNYSQKLCMIITNKTQDRIISTYYPSCYGIPEGDEYMTWLSHLKFYDHEVGPGDEINVFVNFRYRFDNSYDTSFEVKEAGFYLVYEEQEQAGVHLAQQQNIQPTCNETSQKSFRRKRWCGLGNFWNTCTTGHW